MAATADAEVRLSAEFRNMQMRTRSALVLEERDDGRCPTPMDRAVGFLVEMGDGIEAGAEEHHVRMASMPVRTLMAGGGCYGWF